MTLLPSLGVLALVAAVSLSCFDGRVGSGARYDPVGFDLSLSFYLEREAGLVGVRAVDPIGMATDYRKDVELSRVQVVEGSLNAPLGMLRAANSIREGLDEGLADSGGIVLGIEVQGRHALVAVGLPSRSSPLDPDDVLPHMLASGVDERFVVADGWEYFDRRFWPSRRQLLSLSALLAIDAFLDAESGGPPVKGFAAYALFSGPLTNRDFELAVESFPVRSERFGVTSGETLDDEQYSYQLTLGPQRSLLQCLDLLDSLDRIVEQSGREGELAVLGLTLSLPGP